MTVARMQQYSALNNREHALNEIGLVTSQSLELEEISQTVLAKILELFDLDAGGLRLIERELLVLKAHLGLSTNFIAEETCIALEHCFCGKCAMTGKVQVMRDLPSEPAFVDTLCAKEGFESSLSIPMKSKGRVVGVIHLASQEKNAFSEMDQETLVTIGDRVGSVIENAILYEQAKQRAVHLEAANLVGQRVTALLNLDSLLDEVVVLIREKFGYDHCHIFLVDEEAGDLVLKQADGPGAEMIKARGLRLKIGQQGITGWVAQTGRVFLCNDVSREPRYHPEELLPKTKAELAVPLCIAQRIIGILDVQCDRCDAFNREDITAMQIVGSQVATAVENARLFQETRQRYSTMLALHEISLDVSSQLEMELLLEGILRRGVQLLGARSGSLCLYNADSRLIYNIANYDTGHDWIGVTLRPGQGLIGQVILTGRPLIVNDYDHWHGKVELFSGTPHTRMIGVPLLSQDQIIGGIVVRNDAHARPFDQNDVWLLSLFADLATIAIKNAELHTQVKQFNQDLERRVVERTQELTRTKEEVATKAQQLRSLLAKTIRIQEEEQARIARDMHDEVIQLITATKYEVRAARAAAGETLSASVHERLDATRELLDEIEKEIRRTIYDLHPVILDSVGLVPGLHKYAQRFQEVSGIACNIHIVGTPVPLPPPTTVAMYRLVEESLHNVATHSKAKSAAVVVDYELNTLCVTVEDDGQGFDYLHLAETRNGQHLGLLGMQERVRILAGEMKLWSEPGQGTRVTFQLPIKGVQ